MSFGILYSSYKAILTARIEFQLDLTSKKLSHSYSEK